LNFEGWSSAPPTVLVMPARSKAWATRRWNGASEIKSMNGQPHSDADLRHYVYLDNADKVIEGTHPLILIRN
jgi:hypothetical protein